VTEFELNVIHQLKINNKLTIIQMVNKSTNSWNPKELDAIRKDIDLTIIMDKDKKI